MSNNEKLSPGMVLGRYELLLPIAQGGMATVWAARQKGSRGFQKTVAIKTMLPALSDDPQFEQMFLDEASLAARIHHPNVAEILDLGEQDEVLYIVMEWVDGEALSVLTKTAKKNTVPIPQRIALRIVRQACAGLHAAHELKDDNDQLLNLVHRDVSPQNILVSYDGIVKLVDFGVAKALGRAGGETSAGQLKGKVPYMSPEQAKGGGIDRRTDVFAMGIVLYRLTTGLHPFLGENDLVTMKNIITRPVLPPRMKNPTFPIELERVLLTCLQKDPDKRYQSMLELDGALERVLANAGSSVVDDDIGAFVRSLMGDRGQKRRASLRDAVRAADERAAGIAMPAGAPTQPTIHEAVSDIVITRMNSMLTSMPPSRPSESSMIPPSPEMFEATGAALGRGMSGSMVPPESMEPQRRRSGLIVAATAAAVVTLGGTFLFLKSTMGTQPPGNIAGAQAPQAAPPPPPVPLPSPTPPPPVAQAAPAPAGTGAVLDINDLPTVEANDAKPETKPVSAPKTSTAPKSGSATTATTSAPASTSKSKTWVPSVQNPGF
ncbi:serine/threonine protein kinase [Polyangium aurulentum]|uniref:serine/threonine protein kinase n=1 Tax=Polyangium aurulentum TaxID=2567896 RepID=UPI0010AE9300|nr:serine/threonine-protein kinase [Polyangium aurulentum]UQA56271.1 serine/threonine protein kinase [Polyangium aurulentum]